MELSWILAKDSIDEGGNRYDTHILVDAHSKRAFGYVEEPSKATNQILFVAAPYETKMRRYLDLDSAKGYVELCAINDEAGEREADMSELEEKSVPRPVKA